MCLSMEAWRSISCCRKNIQLLPTLLGGQSFRWKRIKEDHYLGVFQNIVWELVQTDGEIRFRGHGNRDAASDEEKLRLYLRLDENVEELYKLWSNKDADFMKVSKKFYAVRMLRQDVTENVFSFICSSNNNIIRITSLVEKLCNLYGDPIATVDGVTYHSFPKVEALAGPKVEAKLREAGFGYRALFIQKSASTIDTIGEKIWVDHVKSLDYPRAKQELVALTGIGRKVADCICLMSLGHMEAVPVDTHVLKIARNKYLPHLKQKRALTDKVYDEVGDFFRELFGSHAGWAQTILFCDDLKTFQSQKRKNGDKLLASNKKSNKPD